MMKRATIFSLYLVCALQMSVTMSVKARNAPSNRYTGSDWNAAPELVRAFFVIGYAHGYSRGLKAGGVFEIDEW